MSQNLHTGYYETPDGLQVDKAPGAKLIYTFDWSEWLSTGDTLATATYDITTRTNDPTPLIKESEGISGNFTYVEVSAGALNKTYTVNVTVTTADGLVDVRYLRVKITNRSA